MIETSPRFFSRFPEQFGGKIPFIVTDLIDRLRKINATLSEGIFRLSGSARDTSDLCYALDKGRISNWESFNNVNTVACALKKYFRDMIPLNPLFPHNVYDDLVRISQIQDTPESIANQFREIILSFSKPRLYTIVFLFNYLLEVESNSTKNKMNANNLAIVFAPNLICKISHDQQDALLSNSVQNKVISTIIRHGNMIFKDISIPESAFIKDEDLPIISYPPIDKAHVERLVQMRGYRRKSIIPFVPYDLLQDPNFVRPSRIVAFDKL